MAKPKNEAQPEPAAVDPAQQELDAAAVRKRVKITDFKVHTSVGRFFSGAKPELPAHEADGLVAEGRAENLK